MAFTQTESNQQYAQSIAFGSLHSSMHNSMMAVQRAACTAAAACRIMLRNAMKTRTEMALRYDEVYYSDAACMLVLCSHYICHNCDLNLCHAELLTPGSCQYGAVSVGY